MIKTSAAAKYKNVGSTPFDTANTTPVTVTIICPTTIPVVTRNNINTQDTYQKVIFENKAEEMEPVRCYIKITQNVED